MPKYDYQCEANQQIVEVIHKMSETITTWQELCERADLDTGETPLDSPVTRLITGGSVNKISELPRFDPSILPK